MNHSHCTACNTPIDWLWVELCNRCIDERQDLYYQERANRGRGRAWLDQLLWEAKSESRTS